LLEERRPLLAPNPGLGQGRSRRRRRPFELRLPFRAATVGAEADVHQPALTEEDKYVLSGGRLDGIADRPAAGVAGGEKKAH
jgi:hypothetical protein